MQLGPPPASATPPLLLDVPLDPLPVLEPLLVPLLVLEPLPRPLLDEPVLPDDELLDELSPEEVPLLDELPLDDPLPVLEPLLVPLLLVPRGVVALDGSPWSAAHAITRQVAAPAATKMGLPKRCMQL